MTRDGFHASLAERIAAWAGEHGPGLVVGLSGPQGAGKTTIARAVAAQLEGVGLRTAVFGLDDLYLAKAARERMAREVHPLLVTRGPPGTHDVALGVERLRALRQPGEVRLPRFDKSLDDRAPVASAFQGPADVILFEGWCLKLRPQPEAAVATPVNVLEREEDGDGRWRSHVNAQLSGPYAELWSEIDRLIVLTAPDWSAVVRWRAEAEADNGAMSRAELARFLQHYERLTRWAQAELPPRADLHVALGEDRQPSPFSM